MEYTELPDDARVWVYQSEQEFSEDISREIDLRAKTFLSSWATHGTPLKASIEVFHKRFIVIFLDENHASASGCSIDKSVHFIKSLEQKFNLKLMNRLVVTYLQDDQIHADHFQDIVKKLESGEISSNALFFNNLVENKKAFIDAWKVPFDQTWMASSLA
ncbi:MAG: ABC transporter ATPase [Flavobacteriales bacterium]|nr:ABC transporter ATPase [Flavobacteriales bacterium]